MVVPFLAEFEGFFGFDGIGGYVGGSFVLFYIHIIKLFTRL